LVISDSTTFATSCDPDARCRCPIPIVAARLCHARASTTPNVYAHAVPGGDRLAAETLWRRASGAVGATPQEAPAFYAL
jgi:hypothetical protein